MKNLINFSCFLLLLLFSSCAKDETPGGGIDDKPGTVGVTMLEPVSSCKEVVEKGLHFSAAPNQYKFSFNTDGEWKASLFVEPDEKGAVDWCTIDRANGNAGTNTILISVVSNETENEKTAKLKINAGSKEIVINISQSEEEVLLLNQYGFDIDYNGGNFEVKIRHNVSYTIEIEEAGKGWIHRMEPQAFTRAVVEDTEYFSVDPNTDDMRESFIYIINKEKGFRESVCVKQDASPTMIVNVELTPESYIAKAPATSFTINVETNAREWTAFSSTEWMTVSPNIASSTINVTLTANTDAERTGTVTFKSGDVRKEVTVKQLAPLTVAETSLYFLKEGGNKYVAVENNDNWEVTASDAWITCSKNGGNVAITVAANDGGYRTGMVIVKTADEEATIEVKQEGNENIQCPLEGYHLVWNDEFSQEGIDLNRQNWTHEVKNSGWVNHELQNYVNTKTPKGNRVTEVSNGTLKINCLKEDDRVYSARVYAKVNSGWQYGYVEAKINLPSGKGTWPAFWMMPVHFTSWPHDGEIDIMEEVGYHKDYVSSSLHADGHVHTNGTQVTKEVYCKGAEGEFHIYGMEWTPDYFQFYVDGNKTLYYKNPGTGVRDWPYDAPFYVILNLAWGGDWGGSHGVDESKLPVTMEVDYVRVFQK